MTPRITYEQTRLPNARNLNLCFCLLFDKVLPPSSFFDMYLYFALPLLYFDRQNYLFTSIRLPPIPHLLLSLPQSVVVWIPTICNRTTMNLCT